jgi:hypothetical protein
VHMMISAFCVFRIANRYTFNTIFERDMLDPARRDHYRQMIGDLVLDYLSSPSHTGAAGQAGAS